MQNYIIEFINIIFEVCILIFCAHIVSERREKRTLYGILFLASVGTGYMLIDIFVSQRLVYMLKTAITFFVIVKIYYKNSIFKSILITAVFMCVVTVADIITSVIITYLINCSYDEQLANITLIGSYISDFIVLSLMIPMCVLSKRKYRSLPILYCIYLIMCPICSCFIILIVDVLLQKAAVDNPYYVVIPALAVFYINAAMFNVFETYTYKLELNEIRQKEKLNWENYQILSDSEETIRLLRHDMKNHLGVISSYINNGAADDAARYIDTINGEIDSKGKAIYTQNQTIDAIINMKHNYASRNCISYFVKTDIQNEIKILSVDLCTVLGNAIDNAIEASMQSEQKFVSISITDDESRVLFVITNSTKKQGEANNWFRTTKDDVKNHGLGIKNMKKTLKKYDGILDFNYTDNMCTLRFSMRNDLFVPV